LANIFMFHELPPAVRRTVFRECARFLKPGGRFVPVDSVRRGDRPDYDGLLDLSRKTITSHTTRPTSPKIFKRLPMRSA
jgi:ubiquinone/menaquinone biosynthesis C-methylase UbiE